MPHHCGFNTVEISRSYRVSKHSNSLLERPQKSILFTLFSILYCKVRKEWFGVDLKVS